MPTPPIVRHIQSAVTGMKNLAAASLPLLKNLGKLTVELSNLAGKKVLGGIKNLFTRDLGADLTNLVPIVGKTRAAFELLKGTIASIGKSTVGEVNELKRGMRNAAVTISQSIELVNKTTGAVVDNTLQELALIEPQLERIQKNLIEAAPQLVGVTTKDLLATFNQVNIQFGNIVGQLKGSGFASEFEAAEAITKQLATAMKTVGLQTREINQEVRALFTGDIDVNARLARQLKITGAQIKQHKRPPRQGGRYCS